MKSYVWLSFAFMGWAYYEISGGADFVPQEPVVAVVETLPAPAPVVEVVTRAETASLISVSTSNIEPVAEPASAPEAVIVQASAPAPAPVIEPEPEVIEVVAPAPAPVLDLRQVAGSRVNMRMGPGTNFDVITTLNGGTELEVLSVNADGWANVLTVDRGIEGWMAERLLTDPTQ